MFLCHLANWFYPPPAAAPAEDRPPVVAPALPARRPAAPAPAVQVAVSPTADCLLIQVEGEANVQSAGALMDGLLRPTARRPLVVILDLSGLRSISCLAMGVLVAYRRGVVRNGGRVLLAEQLQPSVRESLTRAELLDLFEITAEAGPTRNHPTHPIPA
jgi:anti-anti-sigma factor